MRGVPDVIGQREELRRRRIAVGVRYAHDKRRELARLGPGELRELERTGTVAPRLLPFVEQAREEAVLLVGALGGEEALSPQKLAAVRDLSRLGLLVSALLSRALQRSELDLDECSKIATLIAGRRALFGLIGLERLEKTLDLHTYLAMRDAEAREREAAQARFSEAIASSPDAELVVESDRSAGDDGRAEAEVPS